MYLNKVYLLIYVGNLAIDCSLIYWLFFESAFMVEKVVDRCGQGEGVISIWKKMDIVVERQVIDIKGRFGFKCEEDCCNQSRLLNELLWNSKLVLDCFDFLFVKYYSGKCKSELELEVKE